MSILITANATITRRLPLTATNSYGANGFPQLTKSGATFAVLEQFHMQNLQDETRHHTGSRYSAPMT
jgi:hypothetical protein